MPSRTKNPETVLAESGDATLVSDSAAPIEDVKPLTDLAKFGGRGDSKLLLSEAAIGKIKRRSLSPSTADAMTGCSARWAIEQLLPRHEDPFGAAELGSSGHRVFEIIFDMPKEERTVTAALEIIGKLQHDVDGKLAIPTDPNDLDRWHNCVTKTVTGLWAIENPREIDVVGLELHLNGIEIADGVPFNGYIDRLRLDADGGEIVGDFKTGKVPNKRYGDKHGDQIRAYGLARAAMEGCSMPVGGEVLYSQHEELHVVDYSPSAMEATGEKFSTAWRTLNKQTTSAEFSTKTGALCGWCPAVEVCPAAIKEGKVARKEGMPAGELLGIGETSVSVSITAKPGSAGQEPEARGTSSTKTDKIKDVPMYEPKPWEESNDDGSLNLASYAATGAFGIVEIAVDVLHTNGQEISSKTVKAFSETIQHIIENVYVGLGEGNVSFQAGRHTRLRGAVRTALETITIPFGGNEDEWDKWVKRATVRTNAIAKTAVSLWENEERAERPWTVLATKEASDDFADA